MERTMKAARFYNPNKPLKVEMVSIPVPSENEVLIEVKASGLCGSDLHIIKGETTASSPITLGHEGAGVIAQIGSRVEDWAIGDRVCVDCTVVCRECYNCLKGRESICIKRETIGIHRDGFFAQYAKVPVRNLIRLPQHIPFEQGAILTDAVATPFHALSKRAKLEVGDSIAIFGMGGLGSHAIQLARMMGAETIIAIDVNEGALESGYHFDADVKINASKFNPVERILEFTNGKGVDIAIDFVGKNAILNQCIKSLKIGGKAIVVGLGPDSINVSSLTEFARKEFELIGSIAFEKAEIEKIIQLVVSGRLDLSKSISKRISLNEVNGGFELLDKKIGNLIRIVITDFQ